MKGYKTYLFFLSVLLVILLAAGYYAPRVTSWEQTFSDKDKIPFGTYITYHQISDIFPIAGMQTCRKPVYNIAATQQTPGVYIIIANIVKLNRYDYSALVNYISKGGEVFIAATDFGPYLKQKLKFNLDHDFNEGSGNYIGTNSKKIQGDVFHVTRHNVNSCFFSKIDTANTVVLGRNYNLHSNFIRIKMGKGALYLHTNPFIFCNYGMLQHQGSAYCAYALSYLSNSKTVLWDEYYTQGPEGDESVMRVFLHNNQLKSAFYIALFSLLIYVLYEIKRRQRIIPLIPPVTNSSLEFAGVVGQVYYEQHHNLNLAQKMATYFLEHVREKYYLKTNVLDTAFKTALAQKSEVEFKLIDRLASRIEEIKNSSELDDKQLIDFNQIIETFYSKAK